MPGADNLFVHAHEAADGRNLCPAGLATQTMLPVATSIRTPPPITVRRPSRGRGCSQTGHQHRGQGLQAHCPFKAACRSTPGQYFKQFDTDAAVVLLSSAYLSRKLPKRLGEISRSVIDEMPEFIGFSEIPLAGLLTTRARGFNEKRSLDVIDLLEASQKARDALEAKDLSKLDADTCEAMAAKEWKFKAKVPDLKHLDPAAQLAALARMPAR